MSPISIYVYGKEIMYECVGYTHCQKRRMSLKNTHPSHTHTEELRVCLCRYNLIEIYGEILGQCVVCTV